MATKWVKLPRSWSNKREVERLDPRAFAALSRAMLRAVAETGSYFSVWSAGRSHADQVAIFEDNYVPVNRGRKYSTDRGYAGRIWARKPGGVSVASPDYGSNHQDGMAFDIHPAAIQNWLKSNGLRFGISWDEGRRVGEDWHFRVIPSRDQYTADGIPNVKAMQKALGVEADDKFGPATSDAVREYQAAHGLTADGIPGRKTMGAILGKAVADVMEDVAEIVDELAYTVEDCPTKNRYVGREKDGEVGELTEIAIHHWGSDGQDFDAVVGWLVADGNGNNNSSAHEVIEAGRVAVLAPPEDATWSTGQRAGNLRTYALECRPEADEATIRTVAARIKAIREATGKDLPLFPHQHYVSTECPGRYMDLLDTLDKLARGDDVPVAVPDSPGDASATLPTGKALLMALIDADEFPLLRTSKGHLCYYGPADGPIESVSGHNDNSLNPGDIQGGHSVGLRLWQKQMVKRGYTIDVDGKYGPQTAKAAKNLQRLAGIAQDGKVGPDAWYAAYLLPVQ